MILEDRKMLRTEKLKEVSLFNIKGWRSSSGKTRRCSCQKGSILIGLIIAMVVMASLGAGMVYLTTTSTFQELFANNHARAYYVAESGGRYALAVIRDAYANDITRLSAINADQTFTIANNDGQFQITNWSQNGANPETVTFTSIGTVNSGFLRAKRQINYRIQPANQTAHSTSLPKVLDPMNDLSNWTSTSPGGSWGSFGIATIDGDNALQVTGTKGEEARALIGYATPYFYNLWVSQGNFLNYDVQIKMKTWNATSSTYLDTYMGGLYFRLSSTGANYDAFGASLLRGVNIFSSGGSNLNAGNTYIVLWKDINGQQRDLLAYKQLDATSGIVVETTPFYDTMEGGTNGWTVTNTGNPTGFWSLTDFTSTPVNYHSATHSWITNLTQRKKTSTLMSKQINGSVISSGTLSFWYKMPNYVQASASAQICMDASCTSYSNLSFTPIQDSNWHQEKISVSGLTSTTFIKFIAETKNNTSANILWYIDDVKIYNQHLADWPTILVRLNEKTLTSASANFSVGARVNDIKIYYASTSAYGTAPYDTPLDNNRSLNNPRGSANFPPVNASDTNSANDRFTLVDWEWVKTDTQIEQLGTGKELNAIIRTSYNLTTTFTIDRPEVAVHAFGSGAINNIYFDDFAIDPGSITGADGSGDVSQGG
jgi:hypothetical protein